jgi:hypothetical protein
MRLSKRSNVLVLCTAAAILVLPSTLRAQLSDIPVKPGLWETHVDTKAGASTINGGAAQACFTAGTTLGDYLTATNRGAPGAQCEVSNKVNTAHGVSYDTGCSGDGVASKGHIDVQLADAEHFSGTSHTTVTRTANGKPVSTTIDKTFTAKFLASDCGSVRPMVVPAPHGK